MIPGTLWRLREGVLFIINSASVTLMLFEAGTVFLVIAGPMQDPTHDQPHFVFLINGRLVYDLAPELNVCQLVSS